MVDKSDESSSTGEPSRRILLPTDLYYSYFSNTEEYPFMPEINDMQLCNAWRLSEIAQLAYEKPNFTRTALFLTGFDDLLYFQNGSTQCFLASSGFTMNDHGKIKMHHIPEKDRIVKSRALGKQHKLFDSPDNLPFAILAFRGTMVSDSDIFLDIIADITIGRKNFGNGYVHKGFMQALESVWHEKPVQQDVPWLFTQGLSFILDQLFVFEPSMKLYIIGHSLGGALATLAARLEPRCTTLCTFGAPMAADISVIREIKSPWFRFTNGFDPVPGLPPPRLMEKVFGYYYCHGGIHYHIDETGTLSVEENTKNYPDTAEMLASNIKEVLAGIGERSTLPKMVKSAILKATLGARPGRKPFIDDLNDHAPITYIRNLEKLATSNR